MKKINKTFSQKYWKQFELLSIEYIKYIYPHLKISNKNHTPFSKDNGFDLEIKFKINEDDLQEQLTLMEAKMRKTNVKLNLTDSSKSIIIAFNRAAKELVIITNVYFSPQASQQIMEFEKKVAIKITKVEANELSKYVTRNYAKLLEQHFSDTFLNGIKYNSSVQKSSMKEKQLTKALEYNEFISSSRREKCNIIMQQLDRKMAICIIKGDAGTGKTFISDYIVNILKETNKFSCSIIDLSIPKLPRSLFLYILQGIWGVDLIMLLKEETFSKSINQILSFRNQQALTPEIKDNVMSVLKVGDFEYKEHNESNTILLLDFLKFLLQPHKDKIRSLFLFKNLDYAEKNVLDFFICVVDVLFANGVQVLFELKRGIKHLKKKEQDLYYNRILHIINRVHITELNNFTVDEALEYLQHKLQYISHRKLRTIINTVSTNPLLLSCAVNLIRFSDSFRNSINQLNDRDIENYIRNGIIDQDAVLINNIKYYMENDIARDFLTILSLLNGKMRHSVISLLFDDNEMKYLNDFISKCELLIYDFENVEFIHKIVYETAKGQLKSFYSHVVGKLLDNINELDIELLNNPITEIELLCVAKKHHKAFKKANKLIADLYEAGSFIQTINLCEMVIDKIDVTKQKEDYVDLCFILLNSLTILHQSCDSKYDKYFDALEKILFFNAKKSLNVRYKLLKWYRLFRAGNFEASLDISEELISIAQHEEFSEELLGEIYNQYALAMKYTGHNNYDDIYQKAKDIYPSSSVINIEYLSNKGNHLLKTDPLKAAKYYEQAVSIACSKPSLFFSFLHQNIDIGMSLFVAGKYDNAFKHLQRVYEQSIIFGNFMQQGRAANIIGCIHLINNEVNTADYYLKLSYQLLEKENADIFSWRPLANLIALYFGRDNELCYSKIKLLIDRLFLSFQQRTLNDKESSTYIMSLAIIYYLKQLYYFDIVKELVERLAVPNDLLALLDNQEALRKFFDGKVKYINNYFCVVG